MYFPGRVIGDVESVETVSIFILIALIIIKHA